MSDWSEGELDPVRLLERWENGEGCRVTVKAKTRLGSVSHVIAMYDAAPALATELILRREEVAKLTAENETLRAELAKPPPLTAEPVWKKTKSGWHLVKRKAVDLVCGKV